MVWKFIVSQSISDIEFNSLYRVYLDRDVCIAQISIFYTFQMGPNALL